MLFLPVEPVTPTRVIQELAGQWRKLPPEEKETYMRKERADQLRFLNDRADWELKFTTAKPKRISKRPRIPGASKRPKTPFVCYKTEAWREVRADHPELLPREVERDLSRRWRDLDPMFRVRYERMAMDDRIRYEMDCREFRGRSKVERDRVALDRLRRLKGDAVSSATTTVTNAGSSQAPPI